MVKRKMYGYMFGNAGMSKGIIDVTGNDIVLPTNFDSVFEDDYGILHVVNDNKDLAYAYYFGVDDDNFQPVVNHLNFLITKQEEATNVFMTMDEQNVYLHDRLCEVRHAVSAYAKSLDSISEDFQEIAEPCYFSDGINFFDNIDVRFSGFFLATHDEPDIMEYSVTDITDESEYPNHVCVFCGDIVNGKNDIVAVTSTLGDGCYLRILDENEKAVHELSPDSRTDFDTYVFRKASEIRDLADSYAKAVIRDDKEFREACTVGGRVVLPNEFKQSNPSLYRNWSREAVLSGEYKKAVLQSKVDSLRRSLVSVNRTRDSEDIVAQDMLLEDKDNVLEC